MFCVQYLDCTLVFNVQVAFVLHGFPIDGPEAMPLLVVLQGMTGIGIMHMMIIDRRKSCYKQRTIEKGASHIRAPKQLLCIQRASFYGELLLRRKCFPAEITCFGKGAHFFRQGRKRTDTRSELPYKKIIVRGIVTSFKFAHINMILANKGFDLTLAVRGTLEKTNESSIQQPGSEPLRKGLKRHGFIGIRRIVHPLLDHFSLSAIPDLQRLG